MTIWANRFRNLSVSNLAHRRRKQFILMNHWILSSILAISNLRPFPIPTRKRLRNLAKFFQGFFIKRIVQSVIIHNIIFPLLCDWEQKPAERKNEKLFLMWNELDSGTSLTPGMHVHWLYQLRSRKGGWFVPKGTTIHRTPATEYSKRQKKKGLHHLRLSGSFS